MEIASKIKQARNEAGLTQEQAAEALGVSRQTISNWENGRSYPDIVSVIRMSDLYSVSLDHLLKDKEDKPMKQDYMEYLEESTNVVRSRTRLTKIILIAVYLAIWAIAEIVFWFFTDGSDAMAYSFMFLWVLMPVATFLIALLIGRNDLWGAKKWWFLIFFAVMFMLVPYSTFQTANMSLTHTFQWPNLRMLPLGAAVAAAGMGLGTLLRRKSGAAAK